MTPEQQAAFVVAQAACAQAEIAAMQAENIARAFAGEPPRYRYDDFMAVQQGYNIGHNAVIGFFR